MNGTLDNLIYFSFYTTNISGQIFPKCMVNIFKVLDKVWLRSKFSLQCLQNAYDSSQMIIYIYIS